MKTRLNVKLRNQQFSHVNIAMRIALLAWTVSVAVLIVFMMVTVPRQKQIYLQNLQSKANGLAVSLHDVAAGAAINEDYSSVVSAAQTLLTGDPGLMFLVVMKNDGFALVVERTQWRVESLAGSYWLKGERKASGVIENDAPLQGRIFHYSQPFDYSGIQWGWIHVGLSLEDYDTAVAALYRDTILLAIACALISLLASIAYARRMVRPILRLRTVVQQIARGDLSVRADKRRKDELGNLAESVNTMAEAILHRNQMLESIRFAAEQFLQKARWEDCMEEVLSRIGVATGVCRAAVYVNVQDDSGALCAKLLHAWFNRERGVGDSSLSLQKYCFEEQHFSLMKFSLEQNEIVEFSALSSNGEDKAVPEPMGVNSLILIPVFVEKQWWGMLALDDCTSRRKWTDAEKGSLKTWADMLGATIARQRAEAALLDAKKNLEKRVSERTSELRDQVAVKEQALSDLASAQNSLVELSRAAGMAEVATGVLHNVGNVLNSVNVSCTLLTEEIRGSRAGNVAKIAEMLENAPGGLIAFLTRDERGRQIPAYLSSLGDALVKEHRVMHNETKLLSDRIEHIKEIVTMQQNYGRVSGVSEHVSPSLLMEDALLLNSGGLTRHDIGVVKEYDTVEPIRTEKHKVLQILVNLINNAKYACSESSQDDKAIALKIYNGKQNQVCLEVSDNGIGIPPDNLSRIFQHGFTTRKTGHGFGLHSGALVAKEMGGSLQALSDGVGCGSTFTLSIPREVKGDGI